MDERISSVADAEIEARDAQLWKKASHNALARLVRCLFAEHLLEPNALLWARDGCQAWFPLWPSRGVLHFTDISRAPAGTLQNRGHIEVLDGTGTRRRIDDPSALIREVGPALAVSPAPEGLEYLLRDIENSIGNDVLARRHREGWSAELRQKIAEAEAPGFLAHLEQNLPPHLAAMTLDRWGHSKAIPFIRHGRPSPASRRKT